jgi:Fe-Mn family superoxide dismutase
MKEHVPLDFSHLVNSVKGLSEKQLTQHFTLYQGYVKKLNEIEQKLTEVDRAKANYSFGEFSELMRRRSVAFNGTFLHEAYFQNLEHVGEPEDIRHMLTEQFGSLDKWKEDMKAAALSTPGWVLLTWDNTSKTVKHWILFEHNIGLPVHQDIILALDCWEHAFMIDFGIDKATYLKTFFENINWEVVNKRLNHIMKKNKV